MAESSYRVPERPTGVEHSGHGSPEIAGGGSRLGCGETSLGRLPHRPVGPFRIGIGLSEGHVAVEVAGVAVKDRSGVEHEQVARLDHPIRGLLDDVVETRAGGPHQVRHVIGTALEEIDAERPKGLSLGHTY